VADPVSLPALAPIATVVVLLEVAAGTTAAAYTVDLIGKVGRGFVGSTSLICAGLTALDVLIEALLPSGSGLLGSPLPAGAQASLFHWSIAFTVALLGYAFFCTVMTDVARRVVGALTIGFGAMAIAKAAAAFGPSLGGVGTAVVAFVPAALVSGSALAGMLLGHWYLVAPNLSFRPLRRAIDIVFIAVAIQAVVIVLVILNSGSMVRGELLWSGDAIPWRGPPDPSLCADPRQPAGDGDALRADHQRRHGRGPGTSALLRHGRTHLITRSARRRR
jgi:hypothetical protein